MSKWIKSLDLSEVQDYCKACWLVPPLLVEQVAENVLSFIEWNNSELPNHQELLDILARTKRFPPYHKYNEGIKMNYQDYVWVHQERMYQMVLLFKNELEALGIDVRILLFLCRYHDSPEWISEFWDIPTPVKEKFDASIDNTHILYERAIIKALSENILSGEIEGFSSEEIHEYLSLCVEKKEIIGQFLSYIDKFDAMMVCFHEVISWNKNFFVKKLKYYKTFFIAVRAGKRLPLLKDIIAQVPVWSHLNLLFTPHISSQLDTAKKEKNSKNPHNLEDLYESFWVPAYLLWKIATRNISQTQVWDEKMTGEQVVLKMR